MNRLLIVEGNTQARNEDSLKTLTRSSSGIYAEVLRAKFPDLSIDIVYGSEGISGLSPTRSLDDYAGLVIGGSALRCNDDTIEIRQQIELLRTFAKTGKPILGSCWGLQIAVIAAGGEVRPSPNGMEHIVARKLQLTADGRSHRMYENKPTVFDAPCVHYDEISTLPTGSTLLCTNAHSEVQAAVVPVGASEVWGVQYHPEFDLQHLAELLRLYGDSAIEQGFFESVEQHERYVSDLARLADDPHQDALAWQLGLDQDILNETVRCAEIENWVRFAVLDE